MGEVVQRLRALIPVISEICQIAGTPGASIGVLHKDKVIFTHNYGYRDVSARLPPDENTIYYLGSLSKSFTAASLGILVDEGKLLWNDRIKDVLPNFRHVDEIIDKNATVIDFLSHRTGLAPKDALWMHERVGISLPRRETLNVVCYLETVFNFRSRWLYNNWGYAVADLIIEHVSGSSWGDFLARRILKPLGLNHTLTRHEAERDNIAQAYMTLSDGSPYHLPRPSVENGTIMEGAAGVQSSVNNLLRYAQAIMDTPAEGTLEQHVSELNSPFKQLQEILKGHIDPSPEGSDREQSYALGWVRTALPGPLGTCGLNPMYVEAMPIVGKGLNNSELVLHHQGSIIDFLSSIYLIPRTHTAVVVLTNSLAKNDAADWLGQLILEAILDNSDKNDYIELAKASAKTSMDLFSQMAYDLERRRDSDTPKKSNSHYVGLYYNILKDYYIEVFEEDQTLLMCHQGDRRQSYELKHVRDDSYSWLLTRDECAQRGVFPNTNLEFYILTFGVDKNDKVDHVVWKHDPSVPGGETFRQCLDPPAEQQVIGTERGDQNVLGPKG
ncbi:MAG: hypothetical protein Q9190_002688 [Brigantiaea leucoxantha]